MKRLFWMLLIIGVLAGCSTDETSTLSQGQIYQGYPCQDRCGEFKNGYDFALSQGFEDAHRCEDLNESQRLGCEAFVVDFRYENKTFEELMHHL